MTEELFEKVKDEIPAGIGVYTGNVCKKRAKRRDLTVDEKVLKDSMIRSLSRDVEKIFDSEDQLFVDRMNRQISHVRKELKRWRNAHRELQMKYFELKENVDLVEEDDGE